MRRLWNEGVWVKEGVLVWLVWVCAAAAAAAAERHVVGERVRRWWTCVCPFFQSKKTKRKPLFR